MIAVFYSQIEKGMNKRIWLLAVLMVLGFAQKAESKAINTLNIGIAPGETRECYIYMNTAYSNLIAFQIDVKLPAGLKLNTESCSLTSRVTDREQMLFAGLVSSNTYRLVSTSFNAIPFSKDNDTLIKLSLTADESFKGGTVSLVNMEFFTNASARVGCSNDGFTVKSMPKIKGDVDFSGTVDLSDTLFIVDYILDNNRLYTSALDVNGDGKIDISDALSVVDRILGR